MKRVVMSMIDGMHLMIPASEYAEMEAKIERLEKALDKACEELNSWVNDSYTPNEWKEWLLHE